MLGLGVVQLAFLVDFVVTFPHPQIIDLVVLYYVEANVSEHLKHVKLVVDDDGLLDPLIVDIYSLDISNQVQV